MTTKLEQAARQALEALAESSGLVSDYKGCHSRVIEAVKALREALADTRSSIRSTSEYSEQAEQEPVARVGMYNEITAIKPLEFGTKLYTHPVRTKDLTDDEIDGIDCEYELDDYGLRDFARAVIAKYKEKNTC